MICGQDANPPLAFSQAIVQRRGVCAFARGEFRVITRLVRLLENGSACKAQVDRVIDAAAHMQNLREAIWATKVRADKQIKAHAREEGWARARAYLVRYFYLIAFNAYLVQEVATGKATGKTFAEFLAERPALGICLEDAVFLG